MRNKIKKLKEMYNISGYHRQFLILFVIIIASAILDVKIIPYMTKQIIDIQIPEGNIKWLIIFGSSYIIFLTISCYFTLKHCNIRSILQRKIQRNLREKVFDKMQLIKTQFYDENEIGVILQFLQTDVNYAGKMFANVITEMVFMGLIRFAIYAIFLMFVDVKITLIILTLYIIGYFITLYFNKKTVKLINRIRKINIEIYSRINDGVQGFLTIKTLNIIKQKEKDLINLLNEYEITNNSLEKNISIYNNIFAFIVSLSTVIIIYFAGINFINGVMAYVEIMLLIEFSGSMNSEFEWFIKHLTNFSKSFISFSKILDFLKSDKIENIDRGENIKDISSIEFLNVQFSYTGYEKNVNNLSFKLNKNEKLALVGRTGSGKTTIVNLLCRFYEPVKGEIKINNINYLEYSISSIRKKIGYVMQDTYILEGTILDNVRYINNDITDEEIKDIFRRLKLHEKISKLKDGYNTNISKDSDILSTGEKQMINFARVLAVNCDIVILDEVTSALSYSSEQLVNNAINEVTQNKITIIIAHRLSTIKNCDKIILLDNGNIIEGVTYEEILNSK